MALTNLQQRIITGAIGIPIIIGAMLWNQYSFAALFFFISVMSQLELYKLAENAGMHPQKFMGLLIGVAIYVGIFLTFSLTHGFDGLVALEYALVFIIISVFAVFIIELYRRTAQPFTNIAFTLFGIIYLPVTLSLVHFIVRDNKSEFHASIMLCYFFIIWASDIGAYFVGKRFGKHKLFERISPGKTWEGSVGGAVLALIVAHFVAMYNTNLSRISWLIITTIIIVFGTYGDLVKSMFKRSINIKDSGTILPGHGGFIDRFDALFLSLPFVFVYLLLTR